jgi:hypothetical protein
LQIISVGLTGGVDKTGKAAHSSILIRPRRAHHWH